MAVLQMQYETFRGNHTQTLQVHKCLAIRKACSISYVTKDNLPVCILLVDLTTFPGLCWWTKTYVTNTWLMHMGRRYLATPTHISLFMHNILLHFPSHPFPTAISSCVFSVWHSSGKTEKKSSSTNVNIVLFVISSNNTYIYTYVSIV